MKKLLLIIQILTVAILVIACSSNQGLEDARPSSEEYPVETAYITKTNDYSIVVGVESWKFISESMILIESVDGETFIVDKERVTFNSSKEYNQQKDGLVPVSFPPQCDKIELEMVVIP